MVEIVCVLPLIALPFVYWVGHSKPWVEYLVLVHIVVVTLLTLLAIAKTGSTERGIWPRFLRYRVIINYGSFFIKHTLLRIQFACHPHYTLSTIHCFL